VNDDAVIPFGMQPLQRSQTHARSHSGNAIVCPSHGLWLSAFSLAVAPALATLHSHWPWPQPWPLERILGLRLRAWFLLFALASALTSLRASSDEVLELAAAHASHRSHRTISAAGVHGLTRPAIIPTPDGSQAGLSCTWPAEEALFSSMSNPFALLGGGDDGSDEGSEAEEEVEEMPMFVPASDEDDGKPHPFVVTDVGDHAETPKEAYEHIAPLLRRLAKRLGTTPEALRIYDPFFCEGKMKKHMAELGFHSVYNRNEDFYAAWKAKKTPVFDVLVTNPPFSDDHIERIHQFAVRSNKPWFLMIPSYCEKQPFYQEWLHNRKDACRPCFVGPKTDAYVFAAPNREDVRLVRGGEAAAATPSASEPCASAPAFEVRAGSFQCVWFFSLGKRYQQPTINWWRREHADGAECEIAANARELPQLTAIVAKRKDEKGKQSDTAEVRGCIFIVLVACLRVFQRVLHACHARDACFDFVLL
jgi:hypothetical protein